MKKLLVLFILNLIGLKICACDCLLGINYLANADVAFRGQVTAIRHPIIDSITFYEIEIKVYKWLKGRMSRDTCKIYELDMAPAACGVLFNVNDSFEVYASYGRPCLPDTPLLTSICHGTFNLKYPYK
jgi:hypothetical protein